MKKPGFVKSGLIGVRSNTQTLRIEIKYTTILPYRLNLLRHCHRHQVDYP